MNKAKVILIACMLSCMLIFSTSCISSTSYGACVGIGDTEDKDPKLVYRPSIWNAVISVITVEMIFPPIIWLVADFQCPVGHKN